MNPNDLSVVFNLSSRVEPDWICSYEIVQRSNKLEQCIGVSMTGMIKIWSLIDLEKKDIATPLYEDESRRLELRDVKSLSFNSKNERLLLVVCVESWHVIDLDDISIIVSHECPAAAVNGKVLDIDKVAVTFADQKIRIYQLPLENIEGAEAQQNFGVNTKNFHDGSAPLEFAVLERSRSSPRSWSHDVAFSFAQQKNDKYLFQVARATQSGQLLIWKIPRFDNEFVQKFTSTTSFPLSKCERYLCRLPGESEIKAQY
ncbi:hypothetical protein DICVIV_07498 [Dictyocaulus viviparus]|uniref:WD domain, G-beta repeat protein n=1 Tax=Dictyocaulus viviparus TaxID=29172 RepID=A0A0D8XRP8_DICVI|nr:hypothetical protein DICVIV_07498 [Dictyocaulus viviparus]